MDLWSLLTFTTALCPLSSCLYHQYHFVNIKMNWTEAQSYCRQNYTDLATIDSTEEMTRMISSADRCYIGAAWIGLVKSDIWRWHWSLANTDYYGEHAYMNWNNEQPDTKDAIENCASMNPSGKWDDVACNTTQRVVCFDELNGYILTEMKAAWPDAQRFCRTNHTDLPSVRSQSENQKINNLVPTGEMVWMGLVRDTWVWSDHANSSFRCWAYGEPDNAAGDENCTMAWSTPRCRGLWSDGSCDKRLPFFCHGRRTVVKVEVHSDINLADDGRVLQELHKEWMQHGLSVNAKLTWRRAGQV